MASPDIAFYEVPGSLRKPGRYIEFNTRTAVRTLQGNPQKVLMLAPMLKSGTAAPLTATDVWSDEQAAGLFGRGSPGHLMARAAIGANGYLQLSMLGIPDADAAKAATGTLTLTGPAASSGTLSVWVGGVRTDVSINANDSVTAMAVAVRDALAKQADLPVTASVAAPAKDKDPGSDGIVTLTARSGGTPGNDTGLSASVTAGGVTVAVAAMGGGANDPDLAPALAAVFAAGHTLLVSAWSTKDALTALRTHLDKVSGPMEQRGATGVAGWKGTLATGTTLAAALNSGRLTLGWHNGSAKSNGEIAAAYAAVIASEEDPARPLNTLALSTLDVTPVASRPGRNEQENALYNGLTPFEVGPGDKVQIVRAISTYTKAADGTDDPSLLDITTIRTLDYVRKACRDRIALRFPRDKLSSKTPDRVKSELYDVLLKLEELEIIEEVEANKPALLVERDSQDVNRINAAIPADVVNGLHIFAGRIDLLL